MLRARLDAALKDAMKAKQSRRLSTIRLINAAVKDREIAARGEGHDTPIGDEEIQAILQKMIKQRRDSIAHYEEGGRLELAEQEEAEIDVIREFLPAQIEGDELKDAVREVIDEIEAGGVKDMGRTMAVLKERYAGRIDPAAAAAEAKRVLTGAS
jgi:uncharacterized protein YqeY